MGDGNASVYKRFYDDGIWHFGSGTLASFTTLRLPTTHRIASMVQNTKLNTLAPEPTRFIDRRTAHNET